MNYNLLFEKAKAKGIDEIEVYYSKNKGTTIATFEQAVDSMSVEDTEVISIRGLYNGKMGYVYTEKLDESEYDTLIGNLIDNATIIESEDTETIYAGSKKYLKLDQKVYPIDEIDNNEVINKLVEIEKEILSLDSRIKNASLRFVKKSSLVNIVNSNALDLKHENSYFYIVVSILAADKETRGSHYDVIAVNDFEKFNFDNLAKNSVREAVNKLYSTQIESGKYTTILSNMVASQLFSTMVKSFYADAVQKGTSSLKGKLNTSIAGSNITIVDDPLSPFAIDKRTFDDEGVATQYTEIIKDGELKTFLYNLKTASKDNVESTGNGFKSGVAGFVNTKPANAYLVGGDKTKDQLISELADGVYITSVQGLHSGTNEITGDFSVQAAGQRIKDGKIVDALSLITISGNFFEMLNDVAEIANDLEFKGNEIICPTIKINNLMVSGK